MPEIADALRAHRTRLAVWGLGYVGFSSLASFAREGIRVMGTDVDSRRVDQVNGAEGAGALAHALPGIDDLVGFDVRSLVGEGSVTATSRWQDLAGAETAVHLIAVPTERDGRPWSPPLADVLAKIFSFDLATARRDPPLVIIESTLAASWFASVVGPLAADHGVEIGTDVLLGVAPRRDWFGHPDLTLKRLPRVVGGTDRRSTEATTEVVGMVSDSVHVARDHLQAALTKTVENAYRHLNITFANELAEAFPEVNMREVLELAGTKWNVETYRPSLGIGGYCIPVAPQYVLDSAADTGVLGLLRHSIESEQLQPHRVADSIMSTGARSVGILGISYRAGLRIHHSSPALRLGERLRSFGLDVRVHDPGYNAEAILDICGVEAFDFPAELRCFDVVVVSVGHNAYRIPYAHLVSSLRRDAVVIDNEGVWPDLPAHAREITYHQAGDPGWIDNHDRFDA